MILALAIQLQRLRSLCPALSLGTIDTRLSGSVEKHSQHDLSYQLEFETAVTEIRGAGGLTARTITEYHILDMINIANTLWRGNDDVIVKVQIIDALNAVNVVYRQAIGNGVLHQLRMLYLVS